MTKCPEGQTFDRVDKKCRAKKSPPRRSPQGNKTLDVLKRAVKLATTRRDAAKKKVLEAQKKCDQTKAAYDASEIALLEAIEKEKNHSEPKDYQEHYQHKHDDGFLIPNSNKRAELLQFFNLPSHASVSDVKAAYRKAVLQNHPDKGGSEDMIKIINNTKSELIGGELI